ncbi:MAG: UDP-N-acetylmuramate dehydrogenase [Candidatus Omnitrophica bacterium]|nr:UDP-N-acetylmuramate dehydrogenase [Candidatus Omnitrophota bacterium]
MKRDFKKDLRGSLKGFISFNEYLSAHTTFKIGGRPRVWVEPDSIEDLRSALEIFGRIKLKTFLIGNGSNVLARDGRLNRAVIKLSTPPFKNLIFGKGHIICGCGHTLPGLIRKCIDRGLAGLEGLAGIPGSVGGAIMTNAGGIGMRSILDTVEWIKVMDYKQRKVSSIKKKRLRYNYRDSDLSKYVILEAKILLKKEAPDAIGERYDRFLRQKLATQDYRLPSAGCIFKNPKESGLTSGQILEKCRLKGLKIGDAEVSRRHANFIVNKRKAKFKDVMSLIKLEQRLVKRNFGIWLEPEIEIVK